MATIQNSQSIAELAKSIYEERIRAQVEAEHFGEFLSLDVDSGDYEIDKKLLEAMLRLKERRPNGRLFGMRIGYRTAVAMGGSFQLSS